MVHMGMQFSEQEVDEMIHEVDVDGDGEINYEEFVKVCGTTGGMGGGGKEEKSKTIFIVPNWKLLSTIIPCHQLITFCR